MRPADSSTSVVVRRMLERIRALSPTTLTAAMTLPSRPRIGAPTETMPRWPSSLFCAQPRLAISPSSASSRVLSVMVQGVTAGFEKRLEIQGVGYRAQLKGKNLELAVGYSHPVPIPAPQGIEFEVPQPTRVVVKGISKQLVGETAAIIRRQRPPEPYKGKGIRYEGEYVQRKVGKRA